jgi:DEAD/DEAH box helicase domain-containing protein
LAVLVANASPLDQFVVDHPEYFLDRSPEKAYINPDNPFVLIDQLKCAVFELPMAQDEEFSSAAPEMLLLLEENGVIRHSGGAYYWADQSYPAEGVSLRSASTDNVVIVDRSDGQDVVIGEMDRPSAKELLFDNAIYIHRGEQFVVTHLDIDNRRCYVERTDVNYFTDALVKLDVKVLQEDETIPVGGTNLILGDVLVRSIAAKFKKIRFQSHENVGYGDIDLPEEEMHTRAAMVVLSPGQAARRAFDELPPAARPVALGRLARLLRDVAPVYLMSVIQDLGVHHTVRDPHFEEPAFYLYDRYPGGSGLSDGLPRVFPEILSAATERVRGCSCESGCPSCVGPVDANDGWGGNPKEAVAALLTAWQATMGSAEG